MPDAAHVPLYDDEALVIESVTRLDGSPVPQRGRLSAAPWLRKLAHPALGALAEGVVLICCFSLPWFSMLTPLVGNGSGGNGPGDGGPGPFFASYSGWSIARGMPITPNGPTRIALFVHLWLIPLTAGALLVVAWLSVQRRLPPRLATGAILACSVLGLLIALGYDVQVTSLAPALAGNPDAPSPIAVAWGCWAAIGVNAVAIAASANALKPSRALTTAAGEDAGSAG
jgi:hypothetical protein